METALIGVGGTLLGVLAGWRLSRSTALEVAQKQHEWAEEARIRERQATVIATFDERVMEAFADVPFGATRGRRTPGASRSPHDACYSYATAPAEQRDTQESGPRRPPLT